MAKEMNIEMRGITFFKAKNTLSGEHCGMRYRINKGDEGLCAVVWPCPWCIEKTADEEKIFANFECDEQGLENAKNWVIEQYNQNIQHWEIFNTGQLFWGEPYQKPEPIEDEQENP